MCWGAHWREGVGPAWSHARTRARSTARHRDHERHDAAYDGEKERLGQRASARRRRQRHLQTNLSQPGTKAGITSGGAERLHVPPRLEGRCIHKGREVVVLTLVATGRSPGVGEVRWHGSSAGRKTKVAAARRRGSRGSRGSRRSRRRRVRLLPRAVPVFAADGAPTDSSSPPSPPFTSLLLWRVGVWTGEQLPRGG
jgi:hypothetical protein